MPSTAPAYDAFPSETASISKSLSQQDSQIHRKREDPSKASPNGKFLLSAYISHLWANWKWESAASVLVLATPIIIFATLRPHSGQPLPQWPFKVSINSLLSVYGLVFKAVTGFVLTSCIGQLQWTWFSKTRPLIDMLHYDSATRSADGALGLIWRRRSRQPLTSLGCLILVFVVAVDPFVQQLVRPVDCSVEQSGANSVATLPRANVFVAPYYNYSTNFTYPSAGFSEREQAEREMENLLHEGMYSSTGHPPWRCSTGNCTFPETYGSIGICYSCQDTSTDVTFNAICSDTDSSYASQHPTSVADCPKDSTFTFMTDYTDDKGIVLGTSMDFLGDDVAIVVADADTAMWSESSSSGDPSNTLHFRFLMGATAGTGGRTDWTTSGIDNSTCDSNKSARSWACQGYGAATCSLQPCVQIYNATITAGSLEERLIESSSDTPWGVIYDKDGFPTYLALIDTRCSAKFQAPTISNTTMESRWLPYNFNLSISYEPSIAAKEVHLPDNATMLLENGCLYLVKASDLLSSAEKYLRGTVQATRFVGGDRFENGEVTFEITDMAGFEGPGLIQGHLQLGPHRI